MGPRKKLGRSAHKVVVATQGHSGSAWACLSQYADHFVAFGANRCWASGSSTDKARSPWVFTSSSVASERTRRRCQRKASFSAMSETSPAPVGTLCTSVHLLEQLVPKNQSPQSHRGRRPPLASLGAHSLFIAIVPPPIATKTLAQFRASPNCIQLEFGLVARIGGLWHQSDWANGGGWQQHAEDGEVHLRQLSLGAPRSGKWKVVQEEAMLC